MQDVVLAARRAAGRERRGEVGVAAARRCPGKWLHGSGAQIIGIERMDPDCGSARPGIGVIPAHMLRR
jgi:hypothetical protein